MSPTSVFSSKWAEVFDKYDVLKTIEKNGYADISAKELKAVYEPRLLTKIDHSVHLPPVMKDHGLSILPLSLSQWRIGFFDIFRVLPEFETPSAGKIQFLSLPEWITSIDPNAITNEGAVMTAALASGMLGEFCGENLEMTIAGKGRAPAFDFRAGAAEIQVTGAQVEIDAGYEGPDSLWLFEAKRRLSIDFNVRQLYFPFRAWTPRVPKPVRTAYLMYAGKVFDIFEFHFADPTDLCSSALVSRSRFMLNATLPRRGELVELAKAAIASPRPVPNVPFPQADNFERVIDLVDFLSEGHHSAETIATKYEFDPRQSDYYFNAARYLGLAEFVSGEGLGAKGTWRAATTEARALLALPYREERLGFAARVLAVQPVAEAFLEAVNGGALTVDRCRELFEAAPTAVGLTGTTLHRRAQTILAWIQWLLGLGTSH